MPDDDGLWYKDAIIYEAHVRAFHDANADGVGDFQGLTRKLPYLRDLGITAVWLLPFYPSPLRDDGYDIADYKNVNKSYGRLADFRAFLDAAHEQGLKVITELVLNHTSDQHPWFQRARHAPPGSVEREFYVWSDDPDKYADARIIFKDFEPSNWTWDPVADAYYWHRFYSHQPDLNYDNPAVHEAVFPLLDFWFEMGVDGLRLDAIPYLYEREGTNCENLPETHAFLKALRKRLDAKFPSPPRMFLAEANQWPEDAVAYFGDGDECHMAFQFPVMPRLYMALHQEDRYPILDILEQTPPIPENCQWCLFLRNHDELTLEMVTDEERDVMYHAYAHDPEARINLGIRRRLAPLLVNDRRRIELMTGLLFSLPGTPVIYYGDEIGMGDNIYLGDRDGVRTPMQWSSDRNAGFSTCNPQKLFLPVVIDPEYHYEAVNVEAQQKTASSLLWWVKRMIALRKRHLAFGRGTIGFLKPENHRILVFVRRLEDEAILVVANLSRFMQYVDLDLHEFQGAVPEELAGHTRMPPIDERPYRLTLSPYGFFWFLLKPADAATGIVDGEPMRIADLPVVKIARDWREELARVDSDRLDPILPAFLTRRRPAGLPRVIAAEVTRSLADPIGKGDVQWLVVRADLESGDSEANLLPVTLIHEEDVPRLLDPRPTALLARTEGAKHGVLCDALAAPSCGAEIVEAIRSGLTASLDDGELVGVPLNGLRDLDLGDDPLVPTSLTRGERFNATLAFDEHLTLKTFRTIEPEVNPDFEMRSFLAARQDSLIVAPVLGYLEYRRTHGAPVTVAVLNRFIPNQGTAWSLMLDHLSQYYERVAAGLHRRFEPPAGEAPAAVVAAEEAAAPEAPMAGIDVLMQRLGAQTARMHATLASDKKDPSFRPEAFGKLYQRSLYQSTRNLTHRVFTRLASTVKRLPEPTRAEAYRLLSLRDPLLERFKKVADVPFGGSRIRVHSDYRLDQVLFTGTDFVVYDFEGDAGDSSSERRVKRSPLHDVATMLRSLDYAAHAVLHDQEDYKQARPPGMVREDDREALQPWARKWYARASRQFVDSYLEAMDGVAGLLPDDEEKIKDLLHILLLERALDDVGQELARQPAWTLAPIRALLRELVPSNDEEPWETEPPPLPGDA